MRHLTKTLISLSALLLACFSASAQTTPLPLGASDLAPDTRLDPFKSIEHEIKAHTWKWEAPEFKVDLFPNDTADSEFQLGQPSVLELLQIENTALKGRVSDLERRVAALEKHLAHVGETE